MNRTPLTIKKNNTIEFMREGFSVDLSRRKAGFSRQQFDLVRSKDFLFDAQIIQFTKSRIRTCLKQNKGDTCQV